MKSIKKPILSMVLILSILVTLCTSTFAEELKSTEHWAAKQVNEWCQKGYIKGCTDGQLHLDDNISKAEFIALINRAFNFTKTAQVSYSDISKGSWYYNDIAKALAAGYLEYGSSTLNPGSLITKADAALILSRLLKLDTSSTKAIEQLKDYDIIPSQVKGALNAAVDKNYFKPSKDGYIQPSNPITRAQAITVLYKASGGQINEKTIPEITAESELSGWLIDKHCSGKVSDPAAHKVMCAKMESCQMSGFGILVPQNNGEFKFYKFDQNGHNLAKGIVERTKKENNLSIKVTGVIEGELFKVISITETEAVEQQLTGWLIDKHCAEKAKDPSAETKMCLQMKSCSSSGYGVIIKASTGSYKFYKFDDNGSKLASEYLETTSKDKNIIITVKGIIKDEIFNVLTLN